MTTKRRNSLNVNVPEDLIVEILSRVPAASLARFRLTSKRWNALIKDGKLAKKHSANAPRQSLVIMVADSRVFLVNVDTNRIYNNVVNVTGRYSLKDPLYNPFEEVDIYAVYHCDGLLLCSTVDSRLVVWNPCTGETKWIKPKFGGCKGDYALGYDNKSSCYKILMMECFENESRYSVYDFTSNSWRDLGSNYYLAIGDSNKGGVYSKGINYWIANNPHMPSQHWLLSFVFSTEKFHCQPLPYDINHNLPPYCVLALSSVVREEQLYLLVTHPNVASLDLDVWVTAKIETSGLISWNKFLTAKAGKYSFSPWMSFLADEQNKVVVCRDNIGVSNDTLHIVSEDTHIQVGHPGVESYSHSFFLSYVPTLVQIPQVM